MRIAKNILKRIQAIVIVIVLIAGMVLPYEAVYSNAKKLTLSKTKIMITVGKSETLKLGKISSNKVKWSTSNKKVAIVSKKGKVTAKKKGKCVITATYKKKSYKCKVTVKAKGQDRISVSTENIDNSVFTKTVVDASEESFNYQIKSAETMGQMNVSVPMDSIPKDIAPGQIVALPSTNDIGEDVFLKVISAKESGDSMEITGVLPDSVFDVYDHVRIEGSSGRIGEVELGNGVTVVNSTKESSRNLKGAPKAGTVPIGFSRAFAVDFGNNVSATIEISIPTLQYIIDFDRTKFNEFLVELPDNTITAKVSGEVSKEYYKRIATVPIEDLGAGFTINLSIYANLTAKGEISVDYTLNNDIGIYYSNGTFKQIKNIRPSESIGAGVSAEAGLSINVEMYWAQKVREFFLNESVNPIYDVGIEAGVGTAVDSIYHIDANLLCIDGKIYGYLKLTAGQHAELVDLLNENIKKEFYVFGKDTANNPLILRVHWENGVRVPECTYGNDEEPVDDSNDNVDETGGETVKPIDEDRLKEVYDSYASIINGDYDGYALIQLDDDGIPELVAMKKTGTLVEYSIRQVGFQEDGKYDLQIAGFKTGTMKDEPNMTLTFDTLYIPKTGKICTKKKWSGIPTAADKVFSVSEFRSGYYLEVDYGVFKAYNNTYKWNDEVVSKQEYQSLCKEAFDESKGISMAKIKYKTSSEMLSELGY